MAIGTEKLALFFDNARFAIQEIACESDALAKEITAKCQAVLAAFRSVFFQQETEALEVHANRQLLIARDFCLIFHDVVGQKLNLDLFLSFTSTCKVFAFERFECIAKNRLFISQFIQRLDSNHSEKMLTLFKERLYSTPIDLQFSERRNRRGFQVLESIIQRFPNVQSLGGGAVFLTKDTAPKLVKLCKDAESIEGPVFDDVMDALLLMKIASSCSKLKSLTIHPSVYVLKIDQIKEIVFPSSILRLCFWGDNVEINSCVMEKITTNCPNLTQLEFIRIREVEEGMWGKISFPKKLSHVIFEESLIDNKNLRRLCVSCPDLCELKLIFCSNLQTGLFQELFVSEKMRYLRCCGLGLQDDDFENIVTYYPQLEFLSLECCESITSEKFANVLYPTTLKEISLSGTQVTFPGLVKISECAKNLQKIDISFVKDLDFEGIKTVGMLFPQLVAIDLSCTSVKDGELTFILGACPLLEEVTVNRCNLLSETGIAYCKQVTAQRKNSINNPIKNRYDNAN